MNFKNTWAYRLIRPYMWWKPPLITKEQSTIIDQIIKDSRTLKNRWRVDRDKQQQTYPHDYAQCLYGKDQECNGVVWWCLIMDDGAIRITIRTNDDASIKIRAFMNWSIKYNKQEDRIQVF